jgi:nitrite reductase/ring-hydroxylating ferredoxin subunit
VTQLQPFPDGWYHVARSDEIRAGAIVSRKLAGRELAIYRTERGRAVATDGHCPHLGAAFAHGGTVVGEELRCGMHGFCFDPEGRCTRTGYGGRAPVKARLGTWPILERNGFVFVWYGAGGRAPAWDIPALDTEGFSSLTTKSYRLRGHPQETTENSVDLGHLHVLHGYRDVAMTAPMRTDGAYLTASFAFTRRADFLGRGGDVRAFYKVNVHGLGYSFVEVEVPGVGFRTQQFVLSRPTDEGALDLTIGLRARLTSSAKGSFPSRLAHRALGEILGQLVFKGFALDVGADFPVWNQKRFLAQPALAEGDGPIGAYRRWARQFYPSGLAARAVVAATESADD